MREIRRKAENKLVGYDFNENEVPPVLHALAYYSAVRRRQADKLTGYDWKDYLKERNGLGLATASLDLGERAIRNRSGDGEVVAIQSAVDFYLGCFGTIAGTTELDAPELNPRIFEHAACAAALLEIFETKIVMMNP